MMGNLKESLAGPGYVILNAVRALNIVVFLDMIAACIVMLVKINMQNGFFFFQAVTHAVVALISIFLIISELPILRGYFNRNWPLFGEDSGFLALAGIMMILGVAMLGNLNIEVMDQKHLGLAFWRIVISAGVLAMVMSVINILSTFIFTDRSQGVSARHVRAYGAVAPQKVLSRSISRTSSSRRSFQLSMKREEGLPSYSPQPAFKRMTNRLSRFPLKISSPLRNNNNNNNNNNTDNNHLMPGHQANDDASSRYSRDTAGVTIPDLTHHPAIHGWTRNLLGNVCESPHSAPHCLTASSVKSLLIFFGPILLPRLINAYRGLRVSIASRPPACALSAAASRSLNVLFASIAFFLVLSLPFNPHAPEPNIFNLTRSRINTPTDVIFHRLTRLRPDGILTDADNLLREKLTSVGARKVYLTFGSDALISCQFCSFDNLNSYLIYYLPFDVLLPHIVHLLILGVATSAPIAGREAARWRTKFTIAGLALAALDLWIVATYDALQSASPAVRAGQRPPSGLYYLITLLRPLAFVLCDVSCSLIVYLSATNRFFFKPPSPVDQLDNAVSAALTQITSANTKLHASSVARNAVVRDRSLKARDDAYWQTVAAAENPNRSALAEPGKENLTVINNIWDQEEVARAVSRAMAGQGGVDLAQLGMNANEFVRGVTEGLE
ncbi:uncharacterized protein N7443_004347 [Penicillium atrosanguineum]|uniref:uncharacterized protein n=1 Tax=Penicillium atrosanguineum TaxID=1132637 RepID=UPI002389030E|nr:uncharacterized protein N7443_004347 [Penicillium atrosanguineum]KAJ5304687.1 hypothetical protein N7443_004347 [Penicillium atrosanguineum]